MIETKYHKALLEALLYRSLAFGLFDAIQPTQGKTKEQTALEFSEALRSRIMGDMSLDLRAPDLAEHLQMLIDQFQERYRTQP